MRTKLPTGQQLSIENERNNDIAHYSTINEVVTTGRQLPTPPAAELPGKCLPDGYLTTGECSLPLLMPEDELADTYLTLPDPSCEGACKSLEAAELQDAGYMVPDVLREAERPDQAQRGVVAGDNYLYGNQPGVTSPGRSENLYTTTPRGSFPAGRSCSQESHTSQG